MSPLKPLFSTPTKPKSFAVFETGREGNIQFRERNIQFRDIVESSRRKPYGEAPTLGFDGARGSMSERYSKALSRFPRFFPIALTAAAGSGYRMAISQSTTPITWVLLKVASV